MAEKGRVCVTGAGGYVASWLVKLLLSNGYTVNGTVRDPQGYDEVENRSRMAVDVRDVAEALLLAYEKPEAKGRYICTAHWINYKDLVEILRKIYPNYNYPKKFIEGRVGGKLSSEKLQKLGWRYRALEETLVDSVESYKQAGLLD